MKRTTLWFTLLTSLAGPVMLGGAGNLDGRAVIDFTRGKPADHGFLGHCYIFRDIHQRPDEQFLSERPVTAILPGLAEPMGFNEYRYVLRAEHAVNGLGIVPGGVDGDWREESDGGALVVRARCDDVAPPLWKLEVKTSDTPDGPLTLFPVYVWSADARSRRATKEHGFADIVVPLSVFRIQQDRIDPKSLTHEKETRAPNWRFVREITFVFERDQLPENHRTGTFSLNSLRIVKRTPPPAQCCGLTIGLLPFEVRTGRESEKKSLVLCDFSTLKPEPRYSGKRFVIRNPGAGQFISDDQTLMRLPGREDAPVGFLRLDYQLTAPGSWNGWGLSLGPREKNWEGFEQRGGLVLRLGHVPAVPPVVKLELKTSDTPDGPIATFPAIVCLDTEATVAALTEHGIADVVVPLRSFRTLDDQDSSKAKVPNFRHVRELILVLEHDVLPSHRRAGSILLSSLTLVREISGP